MELGSRETHVWLVSLDVSPGRLARLESTLSPDERERGGRYWARAARERFVVARGTLRELLGRYSRLRPEELRFTYPCLCGRADCAPSRRKPRLDLDGGTPSLRFNLSHTDGLAMVAVSPGGEVGIDVERVRPSIPAESIAERVLGAGEAAALRALSDAERPQAFYRSWTRSEAYAKARGDGVGTSSRPGSAEAGRWWFSDVPAPDGYVAALVVDGGERAVTTAWWPAEPNASGSA